ncbi:hypothetical protein RDI58_003529 [Solanum bulbocastanum]|uniref:Uncharacterized protein n=1 Tax=Solanum bulbocastanum TaxID=147425 RepID=A0AAN8U8J4_SOLBU
MYGSVKRVFVGADEDKILPEELKQIYD